MSDDRQPIATAPRDGTRIRVFHHEDLQESANFPVIASWHDDDWIISAGFIIGRGGRLLFSTKPTHWAPVKAAEAADA